MTDALSHEDDLDWENRRLCIDGNCIGVIGPDGRCKECGKPAEDGLPPSPASPAAIEKEPGETGPESTPSPQETVEDKAESFETEDTAESDFDAEWESRRLCANGSCIGVIGPDGRCKECGEPAGDGDDD